MIRAAVIGATGYAGAELVRLLSVHPETEIVSCVSKTYAGTTYANIYRNTCGYVERACEDKELKELAAKADVIFTATPQGYLSHTLDTDDLERCKVIDLSADFRLKDVAVYEKWYKLKHGASHLLPKAVKISKHIRWRHTDIRRKSKSSCLKGRDIRSLFPLHLTSFLWIAEFS